MPNTRGPSISMIGTISTKRGLFHTHTFASSNTIEIFLPFLIRLKEKCLERCIVVVDNLCVHRSRAVRDIFDEKFQQMFLPPHSCELNPIEKAWNIIKGEWRKTSYLIMDNDHRTDEKIKQAVSMLQRIADV